jgi:hypothetical protein
VPATHSEGTGRKTAAEENGPGKEDHGAAARNF